MTLTEFGVKAIVCTETLPDIEKVLIVSTGSLCLYSMMCLPFTATYRTKDSGRGARNAQHMSKYLPRGGAAVMAFMLTGSTPVRI